jgi:ABC-type transport system involved in multi-copper enzyme maturation permease subunit
MGRELKIALLRALGYGLVLEAMLVAAILYWPKFKPVMGLLKAMVPSWMIRGLFDAEDAAGIAAYVNLQHFFKGCNTLGVAVSILFAMGAVAGEAQRGTLEIWLARPLSRRRILSERYLLGALSVMLPVFLTSATIPWLLTRVDESMLQWPLFLSSAHQAIFLLTIYSATFLYSCFGHKPMQIAFVMLGITSFQLAIYLVQEVTHWSLFRLVDVRVFGGIQSRGSLDATIALSLLAFCAVCFVASQWVFARRTP